MSYGTELLPPSAKRGRFSIDSLLTSSSSRSTTTFSTTDSVASVAASATPSQSSSTYWHKSRTSEPSDLIPPKTFTERLADHNSSSNSEMASFSHVTASTSTKLTPVTDQPHPSSVSEDGGSSRCSSGSQHNHGHDTPDNDESSPTPPCLDRVVDSNRSLELDSRLMSASILQSDSSSHHHEKQQRQPQQHPQYQHHPTCPFLNSSHLMAADPSRLAALGLQMGAAGPTQSQSVTQGLPQGLPTQSQGFPQGFTPSAGQHFNLSAAAMYAAAAAAGGGAGALGAGGGPNSCFWTLNCWFTKFFC